MLRPAGVATNRKSATNDNDSVVLKHYFVEVAPHPALAGFLRPDDRMLRGMKVFRGVLVFRGITATNVAAGETQAKVDPIVAHLKTFFAAFGIRLDALDLIEVRAFIGHGEVLSLGLPRGLMAGPELE